MPFHVGFQGIRRFNIEYQTKMHAALFSMFTVPFVAARIAMWVGGLHARSDQPEAMDGCGAILWLAQLVHPAQTGGPIAPAGPLDIVRPSSVPCTADGHSPADETGPSRL